MLWGQHHRTLKNKQSFNDMRQLMVKKHLIVNMWLTYDEQFEIISIGLVNLGANKRDQVVIQIFVCICLVFKISSFSPTYMQLFFFFLIRLLIWFCQVFLGPCRI